MPDTQFNPNDPTALSDAEELQNNVAPSAPSLNPASQGPDPLQQLLTQTPDQAYQELLKRRLYHMRPDQTQPTGKQKFLGMLQNVLISAAGGQPPTQRYRDIADKEYALQTQRLGQNVAEERNMGLMAMKTLMLQNAQEKLENDRQHYNQLYQIGLINADTKKQLDNAFAEKARLLGEATKQKAQTDADFKALMGTVAQRKAGVSEQLASIKAISDPTIRAQYINSLSPEEQQAIHAEEARQAAIESLKRTTSTNRSSTTGLDANGNPTSASQSTRSNPIAQQILGGSFQAPQGGGGGNLMAPQFTGGPQSKPQVNQTAPAQTPPQAPQAPSPATPQASATPAGNEIGDSMRFMNPLVPFGLKDMASIKNKQLLHEILGKRSDEQAKMNQDSIELTKNAMDARSATQAILNAVIEGREGDFMGALKGQPIMNTLRTMFGTQDPEAQLEGALRPKFTVGAAKSLNGGRPNMTEVNMVNAGIGGKMTDKPENAASALLYQYLGAMAKANVLNGKLDFNTDYTTPVLGEMHRLQKEIAAYRALSPAEKAKARLTGNVPKINADILSIVKNGSQTNGSSNQRPAAPGAITRQDVVNALKKRGVSVQ